MKRYQWLAQKVHAANTCNEEWKQRALEEIEEEMKETAPSGSGIDNGTILDVEGSGRNRLMFTTAFHHMTEGMHDGWTNHCVYVTADLVHGFELRITGRDRNEIKEYLSQTFHDWLNKEMKS